MNYPDMSLRNIKRKFRKMKFWLNEKIWISDTPGKTFSKRFKLFMVISFSILIASKFLYFSGFTLPNLEMVIPVLVVIGAFTMHIGSDERWNNFGKYFGIVALSGVFLLDLIFSGIRPIYLFTWPSFIACWFFAKKKDLSFMDSFSETAIDSTLTAAFAILFYDIVTAFGVWLLWHQFSLGSLLAVFLAQIPFTLYHLGSLFFVPPLVYLGKKMTKVKIRAVQAAKNPARQKVMR